jgi:preprotein translocase subunit SecG
MKTAIIVLVIFFIPAIVFKFVDSKKLMKRLDIETEKMWQRAKKT